MGDKEFIAVYKVSTEGAYCTLNMIVIKLTNHSGKFKNTWSQSVPYVAKKEKTTTERDGNLNKESKVSTT